MIAELEFLNDDRLAVYGRLVDAQRRLHRRFDRALRDNAGISIVWYEALLRLGRSPEGRLPINELGESMELTSGGASRLVDRLDEAGLIERLPCPSDRRVSWVTLTAAGKETLTQATQHHLRDVDEHFTSRLTADELATLRDLLRRVRAPASSGPS